MRNNWTKEQNEFLIQNVKGTTDKKLVELFNNHFGTNLSSNAIIHRKRYLGLSNGLKGYSFPKGHTPFNKGRKWEDWLSEEGIKKCSKTQFKKGVVPSNYRTIGDERIRNGYHEIKVSDNKWKLKERIMYEKYHNCELSDDDCIVFLNQDKNDFSKENLKKITKEEGMSLAARNMYSKDKNLTELGILTAKLMIKTKIVDN